MKKNITAALLLLLLTATTASGLQDAKPWQKFTSEPGRFSVLVPGEPMVEKQAEDGDGPLYPLTIYAFMSQDDGAVYAFGWIDYNPRVKVDVQEELTTNRDTFIRRMKAKLLSEKSIKLGTHPGIEYTGESDLAHFTARAYVVGQRPYMLAAVTIKGRGNKAEAEKFFSSFTLTPAP